jgi:hypothetical protein
MRWRWLPASLLCALVIELLLVLVLGEGGGAAAGWLKPPYLLFGFSLSVCSAAAWSAARPAPRRRIDAAVVALPAFACLLLNTLWIAWHRAGVAGLGPATLVAALALSAIGVNQILRPPLWRLNRNSLTVAACTFILLMLVIPISASYYASERFATIHRDWQSRLRHWTAVVGMMDGDLPTYAFGMGLGRFPISYFWRNPLHEVPGTLTYVDEGSNRYLRLQAAEYMLGYGEMVRLLQRIPIRPHTRYLFRADIRHAHASAIIHVNICERLLLYQQNCIHVPLSLDKPDTLWHHYESALVSGPLGSAAWPLRAPVQLELAVEDRQSTLDIDNLSLLDMDNNIELLHNGSFTEGNNYWFFSSDRYHFPWHIKSLFLNLYFELGLVGLVSFAGLLLSVLASLLKQAALSSDRQAVIYLASLAGFLVVGLFDSLLDVPRLGLLFFLVLYGAALRARPAPSTGIRADE